MTKLVKRVPKNVGLNPVARAVARKQLSKVILTARVAVFLFDEDEDCFDRMIGVALPAFALLDCLQRLKETDSPDVRKLKSGCSVLTQISERGFKWKKQDAVTVDNLLEILERRWPTVPPALINRCVADLQK